MFEPRLLGFSCRLGPGVWKPNCVWCICWFRTQRGGSGQQQKVKKSISSRDMACMQQQAVSQCRSDTAAVCRHQDRQTDRFACCCVRDTIILYPTYIHTYAHMYVCGLLWTGIAVRAHVLSQHISNILCCLTISARSRRVPPDQPEQPCRRPPRREPDPGTAPACLPCCNPSHWDPWILLPPAPSAPIGGPIPTLLSLRA